jgi:hypothetical protein
VVVARRANTTAAFTLNLHRPPPLPLPPRQVHGLTDKAMHLYMAQEEDPLRIVRGGIFGGQLPHIECVTRVRGVSTRTCRSWPQF